MTETLGQKQRRFLPLVAKRCKTCLLELPIDKFRIANKGFSGRNTECRSCERIKLMAWRKTPQGKRLIAAAKKRYYLANADKIKAKAKRRQAENPERFRAYEFRRHYGITLQQYDALLAKQNGACAICLKQCAVRKRLCVDHDHETGVVRGLLCVKCNVALGAFGDSIEAMEAAVNYLRGMPKP